MREETRDAPKGRKLPACGMEEMCVAGRRAWTDCDELAERGRLLSLVGEGSEWQGESLGLFSRL